jgi:hypothetical protein
MSIPVIRLRDKREAAPSHTIFRSRTILSLPLMDTPARDALLKLSASLTRDASAPQDLTDQEKKDLEMDLELSDLKCERDAIRKDLIEINHRLHKGQGTELYSKFLKAKSYKVQARRKKIHESAKKQKHTRTFFENMGNHIIERNYQGEPIKFELNTFHVTPERKARSCGRLRTGMRIQLMITQSCWKTVSDLFTAPHAQRTQGAEETSNLRVDGYNSEKLFLPAWKVMRMPSVFS